MLSHPEHTARRHLTVVPDLPPANVIPFPQRDPIAPVEHELYDRAMLASAVAARPEQCLVLELRSGEVLVLVGRIGHNLQPVKADVLDALDRLTRYLTGHLGRVCNAWVRHLSHLRLNELIEGSRFTTGRGSGQAYGDCCLRLASLCQLHTVDAAARTRCKSAHPNARWEELADQLPDNAFWQKAFEGFLVFTVLEDEA